MAARLDEIRNDRLSKLAKLKDLGINPYPPKYSREFIKISKAREEKSEVDVVGRLWSMREHGNVIFSDLKDASGQIQLLFQKKVLGDNFKILKLLDAGISWGQGAKSPLPKQVRPLSMSKALNFYQNLSDQFR